RLPPDDLRVHRDRALDLHRHQGHQQTQAPPAGGGRCASARTHEDRAIVAGYKGYHSQALIFVSLRIQSIGASDAPEGVARQVLATGWRDGEVVLDADPAELHEVRDPRPVDAGALPV